MSLKTFATIAVAILASVGTADARQPSGSLAPKGLIVTRNQSGGISSVRTFGGNAPGASTGTPVLQAPHFGGSGFGSPYGYATQATQGHNVRQSRQTQCNSRGVCWSDLRLKRDVTLLGRLADGTGLYRYRYVGDDHVYVGVIAQDVARTHPEAVMRDGGGLLMVDYRRLGLRLQIWNDWSAARPDGR